MRRTRFVVVGCSRSGTQFAADLYTAVGYVCDHEAVFNPWPRRLEGSGDPFACFPDLEGESSWMAAPFLKELPSGTVVLHQVRDPIAVIRSHAGICYFAGPFKNSPYLAREHNKYLDIVRQACPAVFEPPDELGRCMRYWVLWNRLAQRAETIASLRYHRYRLEELDLRQLRLIVNLLGDEIPDESLRRALAAVPTTKNTRRPDPSLTWAELPDGEDKESLRALAVEYGYLVAEQNVHVGR